MTADPLDPLAPFHPVVAAWFRRRFGSPTEVQRRAWPAVARGEHVLATAPTGSGKTLAAFLWALDRLLTGAWEGGTVRALYVSPLKALNNDVERNLMTPLAELSAAFAAAGSEAQPVRVGVRSGDTPPAERRRHARRPPEILITTPESLNLILTSATGRGMLDGVRTVILDEVHAVAASKRGTHLITAVERLVPLAGEVQRLALSATVNPLSRVARFVGGWRRQGRGEVATWERRPVTLLECAGEKRYDVAVELPAPLPQDGGVPSDPSPASRGDEPGPTGPRGARGAPRPGTTSEDFWSPFLRAIEDRIRRNRTTLVFTNSRRMAEKLTRFLNDGKPAEIAYAHHGSLSREIRLAVEKRFKEGRLPALVATSSLELGIDIGDLDEVLLVQAPLTAASAVQRIGRAGHAVGAVSRGRFYPLFGQDLLRSTALAGAVRDLDIEPSAPVENPLDVLTQVLLSMVAAEEHDVDELYDQVRAADPFHELPRRHFDLVLEMLAGRYADARVRELVPRVSIDRLANRVKARPGAARLLYTGGGTIPDRGYFHLRLAGSLGRIGELDEEFVWERAVGDRFILGAQTWRIVQVTHNDVLVAPAAGERGAMAPFWRGEDRDGPYRVAARRAELLTWADTFLAKGDATGLAAALRERWPVTIEEAAGVAQFLEQQRAATGPLLPTGRRLLVEHVRDPQSRDDRRVVILHTLWGGQVNRPLAMAIAGAWEERFGTRIGTAHDDDALLLELPHGMTEEGASGEDLLELVDRRRLLPLLRRQLERSGFFGARFRENAGRALLLPRGAPRQRVPLWLNRQRSKKLLDAVARYPDFPVLLETWRTCLQDELDLERLSTQLAAVENGEIELVEVTTHRPSPFAGNLGWQQTNRQMYDDDASEGAQSRLGDDLLSEVVFAGALRPRLPAGLVEELRRKLHRTWPGYAPPPEEVADWVRERIAVPLEEWRELLVAVGRDHGLLEAQLEEALAGSLARLVAVTLPAEADRGAEAEGEGGQEPEALSRRGSAGEPEVPSGGGRSRAAGELAEPTAALASAEAEPEREPGDQPGGDARGARGEVAPGAAPATARRTAHDPARPQAVTSARRSSARRLAWQAGTAEATAGPPPTPSPALPPGPDPGPGSRPGSGPGWGPGSGPGSGPGPAPAPNRNSSSAPAPPGPTLVVAIELLPRLLAALELAPADVILAAPLLPHDPLGDSARRRLLAAARRADRRSAAAEPLLGELLAEWLRHYGPVPRAALAAHLALAREQLVPALDDLVDTQRVVVDRLLEGTEEVQVCDAENLARLLRMLRAAGRPQLPPQPLARLPLFLAVQQGLAPRKEGIDGLQSAVERLLGWAAPVKLWESDLLPARLDPYQPAWLDTLLQDTDVLWAGAGRERITFVFPEELPLLGDRQDASGDESGPEDDEPLDDAPDAATTDAVDPAAAPATARPRFAMAGGDEPAAPGEARSAGPAPATSAPGRLFPGPGRFTLPELLPHTRLDTAALTARLWHGAWAGELTNDTFAAVRRGALNRFTPAAPAEAGLHRPRGRHGFDRWQSSRAFTGRWYPLPPPPPADLLEQEDRNRDRARLLLQRYGVVFRELAQRELPALQWRHVFRSLRLMELAGEVAAGAFFAGIPGPQFASPAAIRRLRRELPEDALWWCSALDPASPCGLGLEGLREALPRRVDGNHLVYLGSRLVLVSESKGRRLRCELPPDHPRLADCLELFRVQLTRAFAPWRSVEVQEINGEPAAASPYAAALAARFQVTSTAGGLRLWRRY